MFDSLVRSVAAPAPSDVDDAELVELVQAWERVVSWAAAEQLAAIAELARRRPSDLLERRADPAGSLRDSGPDGRRDSGHPGLPEVSEFAVDEVAAALRLSRPAAGVRLQTAVELTRLPATAAALRDGVLDVPKVRAVVDAVDVLPDATAAAIEQRVLAPAGRQTVGQLRASLARAVLAADPAAAEARHEEAVAGRQVTVRPLRDGMAELWALLPADAAVAVYARVDRIARRAPAGDSRGMDARRADALVAAVLAAAPTAAGAAAPTAVGAVAPTAPTVAGVAAADVVAGASAGACTPPETSLVHVTVPAATALGWGDEPGDLESHGPVPASMARRRAVAGTWRKVTVHPATGAVVELGRDRYSPSQALADLVRARDRTCRFPGCRQPARRCDLDHVVPYPEGPTTAANLVDLCRHHHRLKHQTQWTVRAGPGGEVEWTSPTGHRYPTMPAS